MSISTDTLPLAEVKARLSELVNDVERIQRRVVITRRGRPAAVLVSPDDLDAMMETIALMADPEATRELAEGRSSAASGGGLDESAVRAKYGQLLRR